MVCSKCGQECADDVKFCTNCGAEFAATEVKAEETAAVAAETKAAEKEPKAEKVKEPKEKKEKKEKKPLNKKALAIVVILLLILIPLVSGGKKDYISAEKKSIVRTVKDENEKLILVLQNGKVVETGIESSGSTYYSQDRTVMCFLNEDEELVVVKDGKVEETGIEHESGSYLVSMYGDTIAYFTDVEGSIGTLNLYYTKNGKTKEIADEVRTGSAVLSPNGETVAFVGDYESSSDFKGYYSVNGKKPVSVGKEKQIFAIADKGAYIYYMDGDRVYAQKKNKDEEKLADEVYGISAYMNADCTEMMYVFEGKTYISVKGKEEKRVSGASMRGLVLPSGSLQMTKDVSGAGVSATVTYTGVETFSKHVFAASGGDLVYIGKKNEGDKLVSGVSSYVMNADGDEIVFCEKGNIVKLTNFSKGGKEKVIGDDVEAIQIIAGGNLKYIYFMNEDSELCCLKGKKDKDIAEDVTSWTISADGTTIYYVVDGEELCYSKKAGKEKEITTAESISVGYKYKDGVVVTMSEDDTETYALVKGKKVKEFCTIEY